MEFKEILCWTFAYSNNWHFENMVFRKNSESDSQKFGIRKFGIRTSNVDPEGSYLKNYLSFDVRQTIQSDDKGRGF
jgi:hypothetical protein